MPDASVERFVRASTFAGDGIEGLSRLHRGGARVALHHRRDVGGRRDLGAVRFRGRDEDAERPVRGLEVGRGGLRDALDGIRLEPVPVQEEEPPVALADPLGKCQADERGVVEREVDLLEELRPATLDFLLRRRVDGGFLDRLQEDVARLVEGLVLPQFGAEEREAGLLQLSREREGKGRLLRLDERLVKPARRRVAEGEREEVEARRVGVAPAGTWYAAMTSWTSPTRRSVTARSPSCVGSSVYVG